MEAEAINVQRPNVIHLELLGRGVLWSLNYERSIGEYFGLTAGFSVAGGTGITVVFFPVGFTVSPMRGNHKLYLTALVELAYASVATTAFGGSGSVSGFGAGGYSVQLGYELRADGGFFFRIGPSVWIFPGGSQPVLPFGQIAFGFAF